MSEAVPAYETKLLSVDVRGDGIADGTIENRIQDRARTYALKQKNSLSDEEFRDLVDRIDVLLKRQKSDFHNLDLEMENEKQAILNRTREKTGMSEINVEQMVAKAQKMLYEALGIDPKLERNSILGKFTKGGIDAMIMDNIDLVKDIIEHGVQSVVQALESMFSIEGIKRMLEETGKSLSDLLSGDAYITGKTIGGLGFGVVGMAKGALKSEMKHVLFKESTVARNIRAVAEERNVAPPKIGELVKWFDPAKVSPKDALSSIQHLNAHLDVTELIHTTGGIRNFLQSIENLSKYVETNLEKVWALKFEYVKSIMELRKSLLQMAKNPEMTPKMRESLAETIEQHLKKAIMALDARFWPTKG